MKKTSTILVIALALFPFSNSVTESATASIYSSNEQVKSSHDDKKSKVVTVFGKGGETLSVSKASSLEKGDRITITGTNFDSNIGIYVGECVLVPVGNLPTPCFAEFSAAWISSNPPPYGVGLAIPYLAGGSFVLTRNVASNSVLSNINCKVITCAIYVRADRTRGEDRSYDLAVPLQFEN